MKQQLEKYINAAIVDLCSASFPDHADKTLGHLNDALANINRAVSEVESERVQLIASAQEAAERSDER